jgi:hypothetical protein
MSELDAGEAAAGRSLAVINVIVPIESCRDVLLQMVLSPADVVSLVYALHLRMVLLSAHVAFGVRCIYMPFSQTN